MTKAGLKLRIIYVLLLYLYNFILYSYNALLLKTKNKNDSHDISVGAFKHNALYTDLNVCIQIEPTDVSQYDCELGHILLNIN